VNRRDQDPSRRSVSSGPQLMAFILALGLALGACAPGTEDTDDRLVVTVSILPQQYFLQALAEGSVSVNIMVEPGANPATYEPKASQMRALAETDVYISIGVPFEEAWLGRISSANPQMLMVDSTAGVDLHTFPNGVVDPHIWLSPRRVAIQSQTIARALIQIDPDNETLYLAQLGLFQQEVESLDGHLNDLLGPYAGEGFIVSHPSWGYFAEDYALEMIPIEVGGQEPSAAELAELVGIAQREGMRVVFAQPEFSTQAAEIVAEEIDGQVLLIDPLAEDWAANLLDVAETIAGVLSDDLS
jgi:zinc transport system substrate-binding protein